MTSLRPSSLTQPRSPHPTVVLLIALLLGLAACGKQEAPAPPAKVVPKPENVTIAGFQMGLGIGEYNRVAQEKYTFAPTDSIILSVFSDGYLHETATIVVKWMTADGKLLAEDKVDVVYNGSMASPFSFSKSGGLSTGSYKVEIYQNGWLAKTAKFEVK